MSTSIKSTEIIAERISDFEFNFDSNNFLSYGKKAKVSIKVGNIIKDVILIMKSKYIDGNRDIYIKHNFEVVFEQVYQLGLKVNFDSIIEEYKQYRDIEIKKDNKKREIKYRIDYKNSWVHKTKSIKVDGVDISYMTENEYIDERLNKGHNNLKPTFTYKGISETISYYNVSSGINGRNYKYSLSGNITKYKRRNYSTLENLIVKFIQLVDFKINSDKANEIAKENTRNEKETKINFLNKIFSNENISNLNYNNNFYININGNNKSISYHTDSNGLIRYNYGGFYNLTEKQVKKIIEILKK